MMKKKKWGRFVGISSNMVGLATPGMMDANTGLVKQEEQ
jgi:hypothetical protein